MKEEGDTHLSTQHTPHLGVALRDEAQDGAHQPADVRLAVDAALDALQQRAALAQLHDHVDVGVVLVGVVFLFTSWVSMVCRCRG